MRKLDEKEPVRFDLYRSKMSRQGVKKYYTFLGEDAKTLIKQWMERGPKVQGVEELFLTYNKNLRKWVPVSAPLIGNAVTKTAKKYGLINDNKLGRYHIHPHEFRDLFKSLCTLNGVKNVASEFFMGHSIDKLGYDKSPEYDEEWFRNEYRKVEPQLNVISNPKGVKAEEDMKLAFKKQLLLVSGYSEEEAQATNIAGMSDEALREEVRKKLLGIMVNNGKRQKVIRLNEVEKYLGEGWEYVKDLPKNRAIVKMPM